MKEPLIEKIKWGYIKWKSSIYPIVTVFFVISVIAIILICNNFPDDSMVYNLGNSLFTGIIASIVVSVIIQMKQDRNDFEKKRAILFDAGFHLTYFQTRYSEKKRINDKIDEDWAQIFRLCEKPAAYLCELYNSGADVLDVVDISIIRKINHNYRYILKLSELIGANSKDDEFLTDPNEIMEVQNKYIHMIAELKDKLIFLLIKWKKDSIID